MSNLKRWVTTMAALLASGAASAGMHQICYEGPSQLQNSVWVPTGIYGCAVDGPGSCTIAGISNGMAGRGNPYPLNQGVATAGTFKYYNFTSIGSFAAKVQFFDGNGLLTGERTCTVNARGNSVLTAPAGSASAGAVLTGFSTDASGLVTSGVWRLQASQDFASSRLTVYTPGDFVAVGGGAMGVETPTGAVVMESARSGYGSDWRGWRAGTTEAGGAAQPHRTTAFVIGLRITGIESRDLAPLVQSASASSAPAILPAPSAQAGQSVIGGNVVIGGTVQAWADSSNAISLLGQFVTVSAPVTGTALRCTEVLGIFRCKGYNTITGWRVESKDHVVAHPGRVNTEMLALPNTVTADGVTWEVRSGFIAATSGVAAHPAVDVSGLRGQYAVTGVGATVNWRQFDAAGNQILPGNLLWRLEPRADLGGASVASKDHILSSPATITGHAIGIKLVPLGSP